MALMTCVTGDILVWKWPYFDLPGVSIWASLEGVNLRHFVSLCRMSLSKYFSWIRSKIDTSLRNQLYACLDTVRWHGFHYFSMCWTLKWHNLTPIIWPFPDQNLIEIRLKSDISPCRQHSISKKSRKFVHSTIPYRLKIADFGHFDSLGGQMVENRTFWPPWGPEPFKTDVGQDMTFARDEVKCCIALVILLPYPSLGRSWRGLGWHLRGLSGDHVPSTGGHFASPEVKMLEIDTFGGHFRPSRGHFRLWNGHFALFWGRLCQQHLSDQCQNPLKTVKNS